MLTAPLAQAIKARPEERTTPAPEGAKPSRAGCSASLPFRARICWSAGQYPGRREKKKVGTTRLPVRTHRKPKVERAVIGSGGCGVGGRIRSARLGRLRVARRGVEGRGMKGGPLEIRGLEADRASRDS